MKLQTKIFTLVALSIAGQAVFFGGSAYLERLRSSQEKEESESLSRLDRARELQAEFTQISSRLSAAVVSDFSRERGDLRKRGFEMLAAARQFSRFAAAKAFLLHLQEYLDYAGDAYPASALLVELPRRRQAAARSLEALREEAGAAFASQRIRNRRFLARSRAVFYTAQGAWFLMLAALTLFWAWDIRRAFQVLRRDLAFLGKGEVPPPVWAPRRDEVGQVLRALRRTAQESKQMRQTMVHWDRLAAMGQLAGGVAHEINNPLVGVMGRAELVLQKLPETDANRPHLEHILRAAQRCKKIVRNLLDFSRPRSKEFAAVKVKEIWDSVLEMTLNDLKSAGIEIESDVAEGLPPVWGSASELAEVFLNLSLNAKDAMPYGGRLRVQADCVDENDLDKSRRAACSFAGAHFRKGTVKDWVRIVFEDSGSGMAPETVRHLFETFFTTKEPGKGTGLGLSICHGILKSHGGRIMAESDGPGRGSVFTVFLPVHRGMEERSG